jgi:phosphoesterase RecJ-like protein
MEYIDIYNKIKEFDTIIIHRHQKPDGDAIGSQIGLKEAIISTFPNKYVKIVGDALGRYSFMGQMDEVEDDLYKEALVIVCDSGAEKLISDERYKTGKYLIKIDHHIPQGEYGNMTLVDTSFESCAGLIADFCYQTNMKLNKSSATALYTGIVTDSGRFRYSQTTPRTLLTASHLLEYGVEIDKIYNNIYIEKLKNVKLKAKLTDKFVVLPSGVAYLINTKKDIEEYGLPIFEISRGMVGIMSGIEEISIWANFSEDTNGDIYCELRSNGKNINQVAVKYGGGGHLQASGTTLKNFDEVKLLIADLEKVAGEE